MKYRPQEDWMEETNREALAARGEGAAGQPLIELKDIYTIGHSRRYPIAWNPPQWFVLQEVL